MDEDQHLRLLMGMKYKSWSDPEYPGAYLFEQFLSYPESLQITYEVIS